MKRAVRFVLIFLVVATFVSVEAMVMLFVLVGSEPAVPARATLVVSPSGDLPEVLPEVMVEYLLPDGASIDTRRSWGEAGLALPDVVAALEVVAAAFADVPRPPNEALVHDDCHDDGDLVELYDVPDWREAPDAVVERSYAALSFLSPAGFQYFLPAYMSWVLRHAGSASAIVDSTIWSLEATLGPLEAFAASKFTLLDTAQRAAIVRFLTTMASFEDVASQLEYWQARTTRGQ